MSYTVLRAKFDSWLADQAAANGAFIIPRKKVESLLWEDGKVAGIKSGAEEIGAHIVIAADGASANARMGVSVIWHTPAGQRRSLIWISYSSRK